LKTPNEEQEEQIDLARRLLAREGLAGGGAAGAAARGYEKVRYQLAPLVGAAGFQALFTRSLQLAQAELPCFERTLGDRTIGGQADRLRACLEDLAPAAAADAALGLFALFIQILGTLIGDRLTTQLLGGAAATKPPRLREE
jgi:hypothetical protein